MSPEVGRDSGPFGVPGRPDVPSGRERPPLVRSKLRPAPEPTQLLRRTRLHDLIEESVVKPITLVVAPAGSGKTSLLRCWAASTRARVVWVSLDEEDRDAVQLWEALLAALEGLVPGATASAAALIMQHGKLLEAVGALLDELDVDHEVSVLVIDDLHFVDQVEPVTASLSLFLRHLPGWLRVVVASRHALALPVDRLRARGQLALIGFAELRFSLDEARALLAVLAPSLDTEQAAVVATRAGGWAASIQLAAISARTSEAKKQAYLPTNDDERAQLRDYVWREVLAHEREDVVDVLVATAVVGHVDPELARILTGRPDAVELLVVAEERGLFVTREAPTGFTVHALVREILVAVLEEHDPERLARLHRWAAGWYETHGETEPALHHWLRGGRPREALRLLAAEAATLYDAGHERTVLQTVSALPEAVATAGPDAMIDYAWCHLLVDRRRFTELVDGLVRFVRDDIDLDPVRGARLEMLASMASTLRGHWADGASLARSALEALDGSWWLDPWGRFAWNMVARDVALSERWDDASHEVREITRALSVVPDRRVALEGTRALGEALSGRIFDALRMVAGARATSAYADMTILRTETLTAEAIAHRELGDVAVAMPLLLELAEGRAEACPHCQLAALLELTEEHLVAGDIDAAGRDFRRASDLVDLEMPGPGARDWLARRGTTLGLAVGDVDAARSWAAQVVDPFWAGVTAARVHLATGDATLAASALESADPRCVRHRVVLDLLRYRQHPMGPQAEHRLVDALELAANHGLVQTVRVEGTDVVDAVERLGWRAPQHWVDRLRHLQPVGSRAAATAAVADLTGREVQVLRMLPSRLTLREIADELCISINTLKFHLKVIYRKLDCTSRAEAADIARHMISLRSTAQAPSTRRRWTS